MDRIPQPEQRPGRSPARRGMGPATQGAILAGLIAVAAIGLSLVEGNAQTSVLDPAGPRADRISDLWWLMFTLGTGVFLIVLTLLVIALVRGRRTGADAAQTDNATRPILIGVILSGVVMVGLFAYTLITQRSLAGPAQSDVLIEVIGNQWWWDVHYADTGVRTANEVHIPADTDVTVRLPNMGAAAHNFNIDAKNNPSDPAIHSGDVPPGEETTVTLHLAAGDWYFYCSIPGHEAAGMFGTVHAE